MNICIASENLEALYRKCVVILLFLVLFHLASIYFVILMCCFFYSLIFFNRNDPTALRMVKKAAECGHCGAEYVLVVISIFEGGISMREGLMYIANMKKTCQ